MTMKLLESQGSAACILDAERPKPTIMYQPVPMGLEALSTLEMFLQRNTHPRSVSENPGQLRIKSANYIALISFWEELSQKERDGFLDFLSDRFSNANAFEVNGSEVLRAGQASRITSELPLVAEFLVRHESAERLLSALVRMQLRPSLTRVLAHLEEMIAFDYRLFSDEEYIKLESIVKEKSTAFDKLKNEPKISNTLESNFRFHVRKEGPVLCDSIAKQCARARYLRLIHKTKLKDSGRLEGVEALTPSTSVEDFEILAQVRSAIEAGTPELGLDRLHTFMVRFIRDLYRQHFGREPERDSTADSLLGEVRNDLLRSGFIKSQMTSEILKSTIRSIEKFNYVRNNQTLAHDNPSWIDRDEAYFIYQSVAASVRFLKNLPVTS